MATAIRFKILALLALLWAFAVPAALTAMEVKPLVIDLNAKGGRGLSSSIQVRNTFNKPLPLEMRVQELEFNERGIVATGRRSPDVLVFPAQALIQPGRTQNFRIQYVGNPELARSRHFYVGAAQLPVKLAEGQSGIQVLYNFEVLVSVAARNVSPKIDVVSVVRGKNSAGRPAAMLAVANNSATYGYLSEGRFRLVERDAAGKELSRKVWAPNEMLQAIGIGIVGPGQRRTVAIPVELSSPTSVLSGEFEYVARR